MFALAAAAARGRCGGLLPACGFRCPAGLFLSDEIAQLGLGIGLGLLEVLGRLHGRFLLGDEAVGQLLGLLALVGEGVAVVVEIGDEGVELVARDIPGAQCHPGELVALEHVAQVAGVLEQRAERGGAAPDVRPQRHLAEAAPELVEFGLLRGDLRLGVDDLGVELRLGVDGFDVVLGELVRLLLEAIELVDDVGDLLALSVDRLGRRNRRRHRWDQERDHQGDREHAEKLLHKILRKPSDYDECVANR